MIRLDDGTQAEDDGFGNGAGDGLRRWFSAVLEVGDVVSELQAVNNPDITEAELLREACDRIVHLFGFECIGIATVDERSNDFCFSEFAPGGGRDDILREVNRRIEDGHFAWTLRQTRPVILPAEERGCMLLLCALSTRNRVRGMFAGLFSSENMEISEAALNLLLMVLASTASTLESIAFRRLIQQQNRDLEQRVMERTWELEAARRAADAANRAKSAFLANMSHEIRTPLTSIIGFADMLHKGLVPVEDRDTAIDSIERSGQHLLQVVNDILDISKIESECLEVESVPVALHKILSDVEIIIAPQAAKKGIAFYIHRHDPLPGAVLTDPLRLRQILLNLLGNAIKFTELGQVTLDVRGSGDKRTLEFEITDTGIGIPPDRQDALFRPFHQADASISRRFGGTGLGLYLARQYAELLGGAITLDKGCVNGSRFRLVLPAIEPAEQVGRTVVQAPETVGAADGGLHGRVLVADDTPENRHLIGLYMRTIAPAVAVETAVNGVEAVERALRDPFDIVFMDMQMPEMDGLSATQLLRQAGYRSAITALTANATKEDRARCIAAGCDEFLSKPINVDDLRRTVQRFFLSEREKGDTPAQRNLYDMPEFQAIKTQFEAELEGCLERMRKSLECNDLQEIAAVAHRLKGSGGSFGYENLSGSSALLERAAREGDDALVRSYLEILARDIATALSS